MNDSPLRVLLLDDDAPLRANLATYLRDNFGYEVDTASHGNEAIRLLTTPGAVYHVAVIDDVVARSEEFEAEPLALEMLHEIQSRSSQTETIVMTAWGMERGLETLRAGAYR